MTKPPWIDEYLATVFPADSLEQWRKLNDSIQNLAELEFPLTDEQRARSARIARERGWKGPMPWEPGYVKGAQGKP